MKVLWFTNVVLPQMLGRAADEHAASGSWMGALLERLAATNQLEIVVVCAFPGAPESEVRSKSGVKFIGVAQGYKKRVEGFSNPDNRGVYLERFARLIASEKPDLLHVHGTERPYGLVSARRLVETPALISLQGLLGEFIRPRNYFGVTPLASIVQSHRALDVLRGVGPAFTYWHMQRAAKREEEIIRGNRCFSGRTSWDRAHLHARNRNAQYWHIDEMMRPAFFGKAWSSQECEKHRLFFSNANAFRRGTETLIEALGIVKRDAPHTKLAIAGAESSSGYGSHLSRRISALGLQNDVEFLGHLNASEVAAELRRAHVFALTSLAENSPNSLCEAQLVGVPCVAPFIGGVPSLVVEGETGLLVQAADAQMLAARILDLFANEKMAGRIGEQARVVALERHNPAIIAAATLRAYEEVARC